MAEQRQLSLTTLDGSLPHKFSEHHKTVFIPLTHEVGCPTADQGQSRLRS